MQLPGLESESCALYQDCVIMPRMNEFQIIENLDARAWDDFVSARGGHLLQTTAWGELKSRFGWRAERLALARGDQLVAGAQLLVRDLPMGMRLAYVPRGPVADAQDRDALAALIDALCVMARARDAFSLKIEPNWIVNSLSSPSSHEFQWLDLHNFHPASSIQPLTTIHLDLTRDLDTILAQMKSKWRYNIRLAERKNVHVRMSGAEDTALFYQLLQITSERDKFAIHSLDYYHAAFELLGAREHARLFIAEHAREPLAAIFVTALGDEAIYLYGASSDIHRERMPNHALHWEAIQWAKSRGCKRYDLWGLGATTDADAKTAHGLYQFKQGFGGDVVRYLGASDVIFSRLRHSLYTRMADWRRGSSR
ncbi:peptidoglycan pentaglycine glycine transferase (the first glycine) [Anaerolineae bacterium]|nr:peptidoglycan pentaglycine glycine transferase (the first glycine) [Anaerolineae bacterium]